MEVEVEVEGFEAHTPLLQEQGRGVVHAEGARGLGFERLELQAG